LIFLFAKSALKLLFRTLDTALSDEQRDRVPNRLCF
jgi:hypothetical protein